MCVRVCVQVLARAVVRSFSDILECLHLFAAFFDTPHAFLVPGTADLNWNGGARAKHAPAMIRARVCVIASDCKFTVRL